MPWLTENRTRLDLFRKGDPEVLAQVYRHYAPSLACALARGFSFRSGDSTIRFVGVESPASLDDFVHDTFVRAMSPRARLAFDGLRPFGAYLFGVAKNLVIDGYRRGRQAERYLKEDGEQTSDRAAPSPEFQLQQEEARALVQAFTATLSEEDRRLVKLRYAQRLSRREVSERTGWSAQQLRTKEQKLRKRLVEHCANWGVDDPASLVATALFLLKV